LGEFHDQGDARWIVIRGQLRGYNDTPSGGQPPADLSATRGLAALRVYLVFFDYYQLVMIFFNIVPLIMEFTIGLP
jgi:hypothetical protein